MVQKFFKNNSSLLARPQKTILSAATIIMVMVAASRLLGLVRNRILAHYFSAELLSVYFAAFRLPEVVFEVLVFGTLASAFIPTLTAFFSREKKEEAWYIAGVSLNIALLIFSFFALLVFIFAKPLYRLIVPGFSPSQLEKTVLLARILIFAQGFFLISYFLTAILESLKRFLVPAVAPLFYNLGIILGAIFLHQKVGLAAPAIGAVLGALMHFLVQLPLAVDLGFRPRRHFNFRHPGVRQLGRLALPRILELVFLQVSKSIELFLASLVASAAYAHLSFAQSLQLLPVSLFGISIAKASLPTLSYQANQPEKFRETLLASFNQILFLTLPFSIFLAVLRIPAIRLFFGTPLFTWQSTVQTSYALSAFCLGISSQSLVYLLNRAFYSLHNTFIPMIISILTALAYIILGAILTLKFHLPIWSLALASSLASISQVLTLLILLDRRQISLPYRQFLSSFSKVFSASFISGGGMYVLLKILDRAAWDKNLSFLGKFGLALPTNFEIFVLDTRYTFNLILLTVVVGLFGTALFLFLSWQLKIKELFVLGKLLGKLEKIPPLSKKFWKEKESITIDESSQIES